MVDKWQKNHNMHHSNVRDFSNESTLSNIRMMEESSLQGLLFDVIRACEIQSIKNILQVNRSLVTSKMFGFEGADVYEVIKNVSFFIVNCISFHLSDIILVEKSSML